jgi:hypothetical protein
MSGLADTMGKVTKMGFAGMALDQFRKRDEAPAPTTTPVTKPKRSPLETIAGGGLAGSLYDQWKR